MSSSDEANIWEALYELLQVFSDIEKNEEE